MNSSEKVCGLVVYSSEKVCSLVVYSSEKVCGLIDYESNTYLEGKKKVEEGLEKGLFFRKDDNSVWADLTNEGLDQKLLLRSDGTSVYMTELMISFSIFII